MTCGQILAIDCTKYDYKHGRHSFVMSEFKEAFKQITFLNCVLVCEYAKPTGVILSLRIRLPTIGEDQLPSTQGIAHIRFKRICSVYDMVMRI